MLKTIRRNRFINRMVRQFLSHLAIVAPRACRKFSRRWRLSGKIPLYINGQPFHMWSDCDDHLVDAMYYGWYDEDLETRIFAALAKKASIILDVGANTGLYSVIAAKVNTCCRVFSFEPYLPNLKRFEHNIRINDITNVVILAKAIGNVNSVIGFTIPSDGRISTVTSPDMQFTRQFHSEEVSYTETEVECITLDSFCREYCLEGTHLIKIDVESFEIEVFKGAMELLQREDPIILCEISSGNRTTGYFDRRLAELSFEKYEVLENGVQRIASLSASRNRNFFLSRRKTSRDFFNTSELHEFVRELQAPGEITSRI